MSTAKRSTNIDFLDGYRGSLALLVVLQHFSSIFELKEAEFKIFNGVGIFTGVIGFFILSAFLLTHRLIVEFERATTNRLCILRATQYFIRRLFRIYFVFVIFWTICNMLPYSLEKYLNVRAETHPVPYYQGIILLTTGKSHLWTMPCEIRYYFLIPVISYLAAKSGRFWYLFALFVAFSIVFIEKINPFGRTWHHFQSEYQHLLHPFLPVFLKGSLIAIVYHNVKKTESLSSFIESAIVQKLLFFTLAFFTIYQFRYSTTLWNPKLNKNRCYYNSSYFASIILTAMLFGGQNFLTNLYNNQILRLWGKFSFGIYLFHFAPVKLMHEIKDSFASNIDPLVISLVLSQIVGYVWFHVCEQPLLDIANRLCRSLADSSFFIQAGKVDKDQKIIGL